MLSIKVLNATLNKEKATSSSHLFKSDRKFHTEIQWISNELVSPEIRTTSCNPKKPDSNMVVWDYYCNPFLQYEGGRDGGGKLGSNGADLLKGLCPFSFVLFAAPGCAGCRRAVWHGDKIRFTLPSRD